MSRPNYVIYVIYFPFPALFLLLLTILTHLNRSTCFLRDFFYDNVGERSE